VALLAFACLKCFSRGRKGCSASAIENYLHGPMAVRINWGYMLHTRYLKLSYVLSSVQLKQVSKPSGKTLCAGPQFQKLLQQLKMAPVLDCQWFCIFSGFDCQSCLFKVVVAAFLVALIVSLAFSKELLLPFQPL